ncbi:transmembrane signal receptor [Lithospermum erythrorhizon]|uniref:Transmembrane signal receptor n=1 Tax=Lithospermum erythrorhizon TaxID=34254 RepID=A0AAV3QWL5_LITER
MTVGTLDELGVADGGISREDVEEMGRVKLKYFVTNTMQKLSSPLSPSHSQTSGTLYPITNSVNCNRFSAGHRSFLAALTAGTEPRSFKEAMKFPQWREAMKKEIEALEDNRTWSVVLLPEGKKALGTQWVYKVKYNSDGSVERFKARLVVFGNQQVEGIENNDTFAQAANMVTIRTFLAVATVKNWELYQMDVHNAFLHGNLSEEIYMKLPPGSTRGVRVPCASYTSVVWVEACTSLLVLEVGFNIETFLHESRLDYWTAAIRVVKYLKGCPGQGILLKAQNSLQLSGWCDSDWASFPITRRSVSGWIVFLGDSLVSWKTKKQVRVPRSSAKAEYRSMAIITCELKWLKGLLRSFGIQHSGSIELLCDSQSAMHLAQNPVFH